MRALKIYIDVEQVKTTTGRDFSEPNEDTAEELKDILNAMSNGGEVIPQF